VIRALRTLLAALLLPLGAASRGAAQGSPNVPLDDPRLPLVEHLVMRGAIRDPSPMVRPFRRADLLAALDAADTATGSSDAALVRRLRTEFAELEAEARWAAEVRAGVQAFTRTRRDLLHPAGPSGARPYVDVRLEGVFGPIVAVSRPAVEPRLSDDPDWRGRTDLQLVGRMAEAYLGAQFKWGRFWFGQFDQNWGPVGYFGIPVSPFAYPRTYLGLDVGSRTVRLQAQVTSLRDATDSVTGDVIKRYHFMHRLGVRFSERLHTAVWATTVFAGESRSLDGTFINPVGFLLLANQYGEGDAGNVIVGADVTWRALRAATFQVQLALDDVQYENRGSADRYPDRWALSLNAFGPLGGSLGWQALYTQASTLAFRTQDPFEAYEDAGVGLGRGFPDMDHLGVLLHVPVRGRWMVSPEVAVQRQGAARLTDPFPATPAEAGTIPQILSDPVETTLRLGVNVSGRTGPLDLQATAGLHHLRNAGNVEGRTATRVEGRLQATLALRGRGRLD
jgi:hypothetical protein